MKNFYQFTAAVMMSAALMMSASAWATIWRVNNTSGASANFTTAQAAHDGAQADDTIYFEPTPNSYGTLVCSKKLILIGTGYFLNENPETQAINNPATLGNVSFNAGSAYSQMKGLSVNNVYLRDSWLIIARNRVFGNLFFGTNDGPTPCYLHDIVIQDNYLESALNENYSGSGYVNNLLIMNNIFISGIYLQPNSSSIIQNNVFTTNWCSIQVHNSQLINNITCYNSSFSLYNNSYSNNISSGTQFGNQNGNQQNVSISTVFLCWSDCTGYSTDGRWQLKTGSPAIGAGSGGVDCGIFGGSAPYVLSGMPDIPAIYSYTLYNNSNVLNVNLKVKSHN